MKALARSLQTLEAGEVLDFPWPSLAAEVKPRPGNLLICLGAPGVGKSTFGLEWTKGLLYQDQPVLYLSLDTPLHDQAARFSASWHGNGVTVQDVQDQPTGWAEWLAAQRTEDGRPLPLRFSDVLMNVDEVQELVEAESEWFGRPPALIIVDNASDLLDDEESRSSFMRLFRALDAIAKDTGAVVLALHHIRRGGSQDPALSNGLRAPTMTDGAFAGEQKAQAVLSVWRDQPGVFRVSVIKNRMGESDPSGGKFVSLGCDLARSTLWEGLAQAQAQVGVTLPAPQGYGGGQ